MTPQKIKGSVLKSRLEFVRQEIGEEGLAKLMERLPEDDRKALEVCGAKNVRIFEDECRASGGSVCKYRVTWQ